MENLFKRLQSKKNQKPLADTFTQNKPTSPHTPQIPTEGWVQISPLVWEKITEITVSPGLKQEFPLDESEGLYCLDTETTGLSSGAGTHIFLAGWCHYCPLSGNIRIRQFFLQDLGGERDFILHLDFALRDAKALRTFNGGTYDIPLLKTRWGMNGKEFPTFIHKDLLHPSRRLWKQVLGSCSLKNIEREILGVHRVGDVAGAEVPELYFSYLRSGAGDDFPQQLRGVFSHHLQDVLSLWFLEVLLKDFEKNPLGPRWTLHLNCEKFINRCFTSPEIAPQVPWILPKPSYPLEIDPRCLIPHLSPQDCLAYSGKVWKATGREYWGLDYTHRLIRVENTLDERMEIIQILSTLWKEKRSLKALDRLLKFLEHREKTPLAWEQCMRIMDRALSGGFLPESVVSSLKKRKNRVEEKLKPKGISKNNP